MQGISNNDLSIENQGGMEAVVHSAIGIFFPRSVWLAALNADGETVNSLHADCLAAITEWPVDFYEKRLLSNDPTFDRENFKAIFIGTEKNLLVPGSLYERKEAEKMFQQVHFIEKGEIMLHEKMKETDAWYLFAFPHSILELLEKYFPGIKILPVPWYQFHSTYTSEVKLELCIADEQVFGTLYQKGKLQWHQVFAYETAEDIAYQIGLLLQQHHIEPRVVQYNCLIAHEGLAHIMQELSAYYPGLKTRKGIELVSPSQSAIHLLQQLHACVL